MQKPVHYICWGQHVGHLVPHTSHTSRVHYWQLHCDVCLQNVWMHVHFIHVDMYFAINITIHHIIAEVI